VQIIAETVATLPVCVYRIEADGKFEAPSHPIARLFQNEPNDLQTPVEFLEMWLAHCLLRGNSYAEIVRDNRGAPVQLIPQHPDWVSVVRVPRTRTLLYDVFDPYSGGRRRLLESEMLVLKDRSDDGFIGRSRLHRACETFGTAISTERFAAR